MTPRARPLPRLALLITLALVASAAHAGTVYVPLPGTTAVGTATWEAEVTIANASAQALTVNGLLLPQDTDGTQRGTATPYTVGAAQSLLLRPGAGFLGLAELGGSPNARYAARLTGKGALGQMGVALPVITSANVVPGGGALSLQGLMGGGTRATAIGLVNLGKLGAQCTMTLLGYNGAVLAGPSTLSLKPLSQLGLSSVFSGLGAIADARAYVSCTRDFFAYALMTDGATGEISVVEPSGSGESLLTRPGEEPVCPAGASCYTSPLIFKPTAATPVGHVIFASPAGVYKRLRMSIDVTVGEWYPADPDGKHLIYWFVIDKNLDLPGMLYFRGPEQYTALVRHGIGLKHAQKIKIVNPDFQAAPGHTYRIVNDYDMGHGVYTVTITDLANDQSWTLNGAPNVAQVTLTATKRFLIDMGFKEGVVPDEVPSFNGWTYTNIRLEVIP